MGPDAVTTPDRDRHWFSRLVLLATPEENARGVVLGTLTIGALLAAEGTRNDTYQETALAVTILLAMYWLGHGYATALGVRIEQNRRGERWRFATTMAALRREVTILRGGAVPLVTLLVCWAAGLGLNTGVLAAIVASAVTIVVLEVMAGVAASLGPAEVITDALLGAVLGVSLLLVKILLH